MTTRAIIVIDGGVVQAVYADEGTTIRIINFDNLELEPHDVDSGYVTPDGRVEDFDETELQNEQTAVLISHGFTPDQE